MDGSLQVDVLCEHIEQGVTIFDDDFKLIFSNKRFSELMDIPAHLTELGTRLEDLCVFKAKRGEYGEGDAIELAQKRMEFARQRLPHRFEWVRPDGRVVKIEGNYTPQHWLITTYSDITSLRQAEEKLRLANTQLNQENISQQTIINETERELAQRNNVLKIIIENTKHGISFFNRDLNLVAWNARFYELMELPADLVCEGINIADLFCYNAQRGEYGPGDIEEQVQARVKLAEQFQAHKFDRVRPDGTVIEVIGIPIEEGLVTTYTDITDLRKIQSELESFNKNLEEKVAVQTQEIRNLNSGLEKRIEDRTKELSKANKKLSDTIDLLKITQTELVEAEKMAALGSLVGGIAHEVNTPLGVCITAATHHGEQIENIEGLLNSGAIKKSDLLEFIHHSADTAEILQLNLQRAAQLVRSFKRVAVDQSSEEKRDINFKEYVEEVLASLRPSIKKSQATITQEIAPDIRIETYPGTIAQICTNLVMNSIVHAFEDRVGGEIQIIGERNAGQLNLLYSDNGKGMSKETVKNVFQPFYTTKRNSGGSGLGMSIVYNLVTQKLKGTIKCISSPNEGTQFVIAIPIIEHITEY